MNSELIDKAFLESDLVSCIDYDVLNYKECLNKFAEMIVKECSQKLETDGMVEVAMELKEHFGVEQ